MHSLKKTITRNLIINMIIVMTGLLIIMYFSMQQLLQGYMLTQLQHDAESLISVIHYEKNRQWQVNPSQMSTVYNRVKSGHYYRVKIQDQLITSRSLFDTQFPLQKKSSSNAEHYIMEGSWQETWLVWYQAITKNEQRIEIWIAEDIKPVQQQLLRNTFYAILLVFLVTSLLIYLQQRTLSQAFYIFEWLRRNLSSIRHKETEKSGIQIPYEITPLVHEIEILVDQLHNRITRTRHAIGNLAHELKRPIQLLSLQQQGISSRQQKQESTEKYLEPLEEITQIVERELKRAKISGSKTATGELNLNEEIPFMIEVMQKIYPQIQIHFAYENEIQPLELDRDDMLELIGNLLDNACKFASHHVRLQIKSTNHKLLIFIEDDGQGITSEQMEKIKNRGVRIDESIEGHGLGLSICMDILNSYQSQISFSHSPLGGLKIHIEIPIHIDTI